MPKKQVAFDLNTKILEKNYPTKNWRNAYADIQKFIETSGFVHQQGSVYHSIKNMSPQFCNKIVLNLIKNNLWLNLYMEDCVQTNIGEYVNMNHLFVVDNYYARMNAFYT